MVTYLSPDTKATSLSWPRVVTGAIVMAFGLGLGWLAGGDLKSDPWIPVTAIWVLLGAAVASVIGLIVALRVPWFGIVLLGAWAAAAIGYVGAPARYHSFGTMTLEVEGSSARKLMLPAECESGAAGSRRVMQVYAVGPANGDRFDIKIGLAGSPDDDRYRFAWQGFRILIDIAPNNHKKLGTLGFVWAAEVGYQREPLMEGRMPARMRNTVQARFAWMMWPSI